MEKYFVSQIVSGVVYKITGYGIFVSLKDNYKGLIHISEISSEYIKNINDLFKLGDKVKAKITGIDNKNKRLDLSIKSIDYLKEKRKGIEETEHGFSTLKHMLPCWIEENLKNTKKSIKSVDKIGMK